MSRSSPRVCGVLFGPPGAGSFNEAGRRALEDVAASGAGCRTHWIAEPDPEGRARALAALCDDDLDLVITHGGQGDAPVAAVAPRFPDLRFAITQGSFLAPNVACYEVLQEQSAFLGGVLAALMTRTGTVGHMSGERVTPGLKGRAAFCHGVRAANPAVRVLTGFCGNQHDPALAEGCVAAQAAAGVDILFAMIDGGRPGAIRACREHGVLQIGNVLDWTVRDPDVFIASALADSGWGIRQAVADLGRGAFCAGTKRLAGIEHGNVVELRFGAAVPADVRARVASFRDRVLSGEFEIETDYAGPEFAFGAG